MLASRIVALSVTMAVTLALLVPFPESASAAPFDSCPGVVPNAANGHGYRAVAVPGGINWYDAKAAAQATTCGGSSGYLVTITSADEQNFIGTHLPAAFESPSVVSRK